MLDYSPGLLAVPVMETMYSLAAFSFVQAARWLPKGTEIVFLREGTTVAAKRNRFVRELLDRPDLEWLAMIDSDHTFPADLVLRLLATGKDLVGAACMLRSGSHVAAGFLTDDAVLSDDPLRPSDADGFRWSPVNHERFPDGPNIGEVDLVGTGIILVRRPVFEALEEPWFVSNVTARTSEGQGEDLNFVLRAKAAGFQPHLLSMPGIGHLSVQGVSTHG